MIYCIWGDVDGMAALLRARGDEFTVVADVTRFGTEGVMAFQQDLSKARGGKHVLVAASLDNIEAIRGITHDYTVVLPNAKVLDDILVKKGYGAMGRAMRARRRVADFGVLREYAESVGTNIVTLAADMTLVEYFAATVPKATLPVTVTHVAAVRAAMEKAVLEAMEKDVITWGMRTDPSAGKPALTEWRRVECRVPTIITHELMVMMLQGAVTNAFPQESHEFITVVNPGEWTTTLINAHGEHFHCRRMIEIVNNGAGANHAC